MGDLLRAALEYAERGWPVFPLVEAGKLPKIPAAHPVDDPRRGACRGECGQPGHGLHDATTDVDVLADWWRRWPSANVGLRTGIAFDVVDIDGPEGLASIVDAQAGREMTPGPEVATGGGGSHLYHLPTGIGNRAGVVPKVDFRGDGGYVVAPPSTHASGRRYEWATRTADGFAIDGPDEPLTELPGWLVELLRPPKPPAVSHLAPVAPGRMSAYGAGALEREIGRVVMAPVGQRNDTLNRAAHALGQLVGAGILPAETVAEHLLAAGLRAGLGEHEAVTTIRSGLAAGLRTPRQVPA